jgi:tetratricopeptide (TPR) repeat protein
MSKKNKIKHKNRPDHPVPKVEKIRTGKTGTVWPWLLPVLGLTVVAFLPMLSNGFTNWDDDIYISNNQLVKDADWGKMFSEPSASNYHPLTMITLGLNYAISGTDPFSYHLVNLLLHILNTVLVFLFVYRISDKKSFVAAFAAIIFGVHPMHVESVAWISERKDVLYALFFLLALLQYWRFLGSGKKLNLVYCFVFFVLSLLSKPAAIILPVVLFLLDYWYGRSLAWKTVLEKVPFFILSLLFGYITVRVQSADAIAGFDIYPLWSRFFFACYTIMIYAARFFVPYPLSAFHPYPSVNDLGLAVYLSPVFIIALGILLWLKRKDKLVVFSILFFIVNLLLVIQIVSIGLTIVSERYTYIPYIGLSFLLGMWLNKYAVAKSNGLIRAIPFLIGIIFGIISFQRTKVWKDGDTLWASVIKHYPEAATPRSNHANYLKKMAGMPEYMARQNELLQEALEDCNMAIRSKPTHVKAHENRQNIYLLLNKDSLAMADANKLLTMDPSNAAAFYTKGFAYMRFNVPDSSLYWFNRSIAMNPKADWVFNARGSLLYDSFKNYNAALADFTKAIELNPQGEYFYKRSNCYYRLGNSVSAKADALMALQNGYNIPAAYRSTLQL